MGDPINASNGNKFERKVEFAVPGSNLAIEWTYNSAFLPRYTLNNSLIFGNKRTHNYGATVYASKGGVENVAYVARADGKAIRFVSRDNAWFATEAGIERLMETPAGWEFRDATGNIESYRKDGLIRRIDYLAGGFLEFYYNSFTRLGSVVDQSGRSLTYLYKESNARLTGVVLPDGSKIEFTFNGNGDLSGATYPDGSEVAYEYDEIEYTGSSTKRSLLTGVINEVGLRSSSTWYDSQQRAYRVSLAAGDGGYSISYGGDATGHRATVLGPGGSSRTVESRSAGNRWVVSKSIEACDGCISRETKYDYYQDGKIKSSERNGLLEEYSYDSSGRLKSKQSRAMGELGRRMEYSFDDAGVQVAVRVESPSGELIHSSENVLDTNRRPVRIVETAGQTVREHSVEYCSDGKAGCPFDWLVSKRTSVVAGEAREINYEYFNSDDPTCVSQTGACRFRRGDLRLITGSASPRMEVLAYDGAGRIASVVDGNGIMEEYSYNKRGWLSEIKASADAGLSRHKLFEYWPTGLLKRATLPDGDAVSFDYDANGRLISIGDALGNRIRYSLDRSGNTIDESIVDSSGILRRNFSRIYNGLGQLATMADASSNPTDLTYDANGNQSSLTDAKGRSTIGAYDAFNRLRRVVRDSSGVAVSTEFTYDVLDNVSNVRDAKGLETAYAHNGFGEVISQTSPDTGKTSFDYDEAGRLISRLDSRGVIANYRYDALDRLLSERYPNPSNDVFYSYGIVPDVCAESERYPVGRIGKVVDRSGSTEYCYSAFGQVLRKVQEINGLKLALRYQYTLGGRLVSVEYPNGMLVDYVRDELGRITEIGVTVGPGTRRTLVKGVGYLPFGPASGWQFGNGRRIDRSFDLDYRSTGVVDSREELQFALGYDAVSDLTMLNVGDQRHTIDHDAMGRVTAFRDAITGVSIDAYSYDPAGNRTLFVNSSHEEVYGYPAASHQLGDVDGVARTYDEVGNMTSVGGLAKELVYDDRGRLEQVKVGGNVVQRYWHNGKGERVRRWTDDVEIQSLYDESGRWMGDYDGSGVVMQQVIWMDDSPIGLLDGNEVYYIETDHLASPRVVVDPLRDVAVWRWDINGEAFGATPPSQDPDGDGLDFVFDMRFPGQRYDAVADLVYNYQRDYDPTVGRYIQSDPIGLAGGVNTYAYVQSSTLQYTDPTGLIALPLPVPGPVVPAPHPLFWAAAGGLAAGAAFNSVYEHHSGSSLGSDLYDYMNQSSGAADGASDSASGRAQQAAERKEYSRVCKSPIPPTGDKCRDARANLERLRQCLGLRESFSRKWYGDNDAGHMTEISNTRRAVHNLESFILLNCSEQCD